MKSEKNYEDVVSLAYGVAEMHREIISLRAKVEHLREVEKEYSKFLNDTYAHNQRVSRAMLATALGNQSLVKEILNQDILPREVPFE